MRLRLKRAILTLYVVLCGLLSLHINFHYGSVGPSTDPDRAGTDPELDDSAEQRFYFGNDSDFKADAKGHVIPRPILRTSPSKIVVEGNNSSQTGVEVVSKTSKTGSILEEKSSQIGKTTFVSTSQQQNSEFAQELRENGGSVSDEQSDRILSQLNYIPMERPNRTFSIYLPQGLGGWFVKGGNAQFVKSKCPVDNCLLTESNQDAPNADLVLFRNSLSELGTGPRPSHQLWALYALESPENTPSFSNFANRINWTATYRRQSDLVTPYEKFVPYSAIKRYPNLRKFFKHYEQQTKFSIQRKLQLTNFAANKTKKVAWFVSNCYTSNQRLQFAQELNKYIEVDIFGSCGNKVCKRFSKDCFDMLKSDYKFYLGMENSNCRDYVTEKFFVNALQNDIVPIVMGAHPQDYKALAPPNSYIHVEQFDTAKDLAEYLHKLDQNDTQYNEYFRWKGTGEFIDTKFWCRLCALLNWPTQKIYADVNQWWRGDGVCTFTRWDGKPTVPVSKAALAKQAATNFSDFSFLATTEKSVPKR